MVESLLSGARGGRRMKVVGLFSVLQNWRVGYFRRLTETYPVDLSSFMEMTFLEPNESIPRQSSHSAALLCRIII